MTDLEQLELLKQGVTTWNLGRKEQPDLSDADLSAADLSYINLSATNLRGANLYTARLTGANLRKADLREAELNRTDLSGADLKGADLSQARVGGTHFANLDLHQVKGLDAITHLAPSHISIATIIRSQGKIPGIFLRNAGVPDSIIETIPSLVGSLRPIDFSSCFIASSDKDRVFTEQLHADLRRNGVHCWFAPEDMKIDDKIRYRIDESIRLYDKLLLVLSEQSVNSPWVEQEVETALAKEREGKSLVLFPICLDETIMQMTSGWPVLIRNTRHIGDFTRWKQHDDYREALERLLRDLKAEG